MRKEAFESEVRKNVTNEHALNAQVQRNHI